MTESYTLRELTTLARSYAKGTHLDKRSVRCVFLPCPLHCSINRTHAHRERGLIVLQPSELAMPKRLQEWLILHEVTHFRTKRGHFSKRFNGIIERFMPDAEQRWREYWNYRIEHKEELRSFIRNFKSQKKKPKPTYTQLAEKAEEHIKKLETRIKRLTTIKSKWLRRLRAYQRLASAIQVD